MKTVRPWPQQKDVIDCGAPGPMPQQDAGDCHGHEMHPQELVRLVGCHELTAEKHEGMHRLNRDVRSFF